MIPILFTESATTFNTNGIGALKDAVSCTCTEERNGMYEVELIYPITGQHFPDITINSIIVVTPSEDATKQAFRVYHISSPINGKVTIYARHISYQLLNIPTMPFSVQNSPTACSDTLAALKSNAAESCPFTFWTDVTTASSFGLLEPASIRACLGGTEGSVLDQFGGEYEWDNYTVKLHRQRGRINTGVTLRYGKNITDLVQEKNIASTVTGVVPYWADMDNETIVTLPEKVVSSSYASAYPYHLTVPLNLSDKWETAPTEASLRTAAQSYVNKTGLGLPKVSIDLSFVALWQSEEYKEIAPLQKVKLCDEVTVQFESLGIDVTAKVVKTVYDVLMERYERIEIGSIRSNLITTLRDENSKTLKTIDIQRIQTADAINNATAWLTSFNGYVVAIKNTDGSWKELLFMDTNDPDTATNILRINGNGLGFSTTGIDGPYTNAWTIDGNLVADFITTGILKDINNTFVLDLDNGTLTLSPNASVGNNDSLSSMQTRITANANGITAEVTRAEGAEGNLSSRITQNADAITAEVTRAGTAEGNLSSRITQNANSITSEVTRATDAEGNLSSRITQNADSIALKVSKGDISSELSVESGAITLSTAGRLLITAGNFQLDSDGTMTCTHANIKGTITLGGNNNVNGALYLNNSSGNTLFQLDNNGLTSYQTTNGYYNATYAFTGQLTESIGPGTGVARRYANAISWFASGDTPSSSIAFVGLDNSGELRVRSNDTLHLSGYYGVNVYANGDITVQSNSDVKLTCDDLYINNSEGATGSAAGLTFLNGICTAIPWDSGMTINLGYVDEYGAHYQMQFTDGILTDRVPI